LIYQKVNLNLMEKLCSFANWKIWCFPICCFDSDFDFDSDSDSDSDSDLEAVIRTEVEIHVYIFTYYFLNLFNFIDIQF
jgi:hypothetical protein